jgi:metal-sulfur cluster biosynthetic enzyme
MSQIAQKPQCSTPIPAEVWQRLRGVLDPELDESILELGFVERLQFEDGHLKVELWLPTKWCSPNFTYMMAEDIRLALLNVERVRQVSVFLKDHFAAERIEAAVNVGKSFRDAFPEEALGDLHELRLYFLQKGFLKRQEQLLRSLLQAGLEFGEIAKLHVGDLQIQEEVCRIRREELRQDPIGRQLATMP